jgi:hypothetical protein
MHKSMAAMMHMMMKIHHPAVLGMLLMARSFFGRSAVSLGVMGSRRCDVGSA